MQPILLDRVAPAPPVTVVYPGNRYLTAKVRALADFIAEIYPAPGWWPEIAAMASARRKLSGKARRRKP